MGVWPWEAMDLQSLGVEREQFVVSGPHRGHRQQVLCPSVMDIPDVTLCCERAENKVRALGVTGLSQGLKGEGSRGIRHSSVSQDVRVFSLVW